MHVYYCGIIKPNLRGDPKGVFLQKFFNINIRPSMKVSDKKTPSLWNVVKPKECFNIGF